MADATTPVAPTTAHGSAVASARNEAAQSVAQAVQRVADAAVAAIQKAPASSGDENDFIFSGSPGGQFTIQGDGFGASGTVKLGQRQLHTTEWSAQRIVGAFPSDAASGEVTVSVDDKTIKRAQFKR